MKTHLTHTGFYAGKPLCGAVRESDGRHQHAAYANLSLGVAGFCPACVGTWLAYAWEGEPLPEWPVTVEDVARIESEIPAEFASDAEVVAFREKLRTWTTAQ